MCSTFSHVVHLMADPRAYLAGLIERADDAAALGEATGRIMGSPNRPSSREIGYRAQR